MAEDASLRSNPCLLCGPDSRDVELFPSTVRQDEDVKVLFSARRAPDRKHHRLVRCARCGLVRSDPVLEESVLARMYADSTVTYEPEIPNLVTTYGALLDKTLQLGAAPSRLLEIGCGNGFFLEAALQRGVTEVAGVEPSQQAVAQADARVRDSIVVDMMRAGLFPQKHFGIVAMFHVFDHLPHPTETLDECRTVLADGGKLLCVVHNVEAVSARVLRERSPIFDVEHTYLYSPATLERLLNEHGFEVDEIGPLFNRYSPGYLAHLAPVPTGAKRFLQRVASGRLLARRTVRLPLGNMYAIASPS